MSEKRTIELEIQDNSKSLKQQYREAVQELQKVSQAYGETSEQAIKAAKAAADLKDQIEFSKDLIKGFNPDAKFQAVEGAINGALNGIQAFEGGLALIGVESEKVQETLLRVQAVMALTQGINGLMEAGDAFRQLGAKAVDALKGIKAGIAGTGIGLLVVAVGTLVAYWDDIKSAVSGVSSEQKKLNKDAEKNALTAKETYDSFLLQENALRLQGKSEKEILQLRINRLNTVIKEEEVRIKMMEETAKLEIEAAKRNQEIAKGVIRVIIEGLAWTVRAIAAPIDVLILTANKLADILGYDKVAATTLNEEITKMVDTASTSLASLMFDPAAIKTESDKTIKEAKKGLAQMESDRDGFLIQLKNSESKAAASTVSTAGKTAKELKDIERELEEEKNRIKEESREKDLDALRIKYKYEKEEADKNFKEGTLKKEDYNRLLKQQEESLRADTKVINDKWDLIEKEARDKKIQEQIQAEDKAWLELQKARNSQQEQELLELQLAYDEKIAAANGNAEIEKAITEKYNKEVATINKKYRDEEAAKKKAEDDKEKARIKALNEYRLKAVQDTLQVISNLSELFAGKSEKQQKKAFQVQKAVNISNAVIDTYKAANTALASSPPPFNYIAMAAAITAGLVNVKKIASQQFQASGSGGGGGGSNAPTGAPMTANFTTIGSSGINQLAQLQQTPTQAYVVSGEVTSAQALDRNRVQNATL